MVTYNVDFVCSYAGSSDNDAYRDDLLDLLGLENFDDELINAKILAIAGDVSGSPELKPLLVKSAARLLSEDPEVGLMLLFSYDSLELIHRCLCDFYRLGSVSKGNISALEAFLTKE